MARPQHISDDTIIEALAAAGEVTAAELAERPRHGPVHRGQTPRRPRRRRGGPAPSGWPGERGPGRGPLVGPADTGGAGDNAEPPAETAARPSRPSRLPLASGWGGERSGTLVRDYLAARPDEDLGPTQVGKALGPFPGGGVQRPGPPGGGRRSSGWLASLPAATASSPTASGRPVGRARRAPTRVPESLADLGGPTPPHLGESTSRTRLQGAPQGSPRISFRAVRGPSASDYPTRGGRLPRAVDQHNASRGIRLAPRLPRIRGSPPAGPSGGYFGGKAGDPAWRDHGSETKGAAHGHPPPSPHRLAVRHPGTHLRCSSSTGPNPLALDGTGIAGLPDRPVPLGELKARLLHPSTPFEVRDAIVGELVARSQTRRRPLDRRPGRGAPPRPAPGRLAARAGLPGQGRRHRGRDPRRVLGRGGRLPARPGSPGVAAVLAGPHRRPTAAARRAGRAGPARHRTRSRPPRPGRGDTPTWCWPKPCGPG